MARTRTKRTLRKSRHASSRRRMHGTAERPRLCVFRSARHIYAQIIDDTRGHTLVAASTRDPELREKIDGTKTDRAGEVGELIASRALEGSIKAVVFDRGGHKYHGRVAALADAAREKGLSF
ncbi:MAG: 50S ribosomal protein L18 [Chloroflexota bacterium]|jgi:large subunit ribosomal protein L18|nr:50S ribosomal protein L18 [Chloroflexota bacterium]